MNQSQFRKDLANIINCNSAENGSDTPDFLLAEYLSDCLQAYDRCVRAREKWYGREKERVMDHECPAGPPPTPEECRIALEKQKAMPQHGIDCVKIGHFDGEIAKTYGHAPDYDGVYSKAGISFCGRCHAEL